MHFCNQSRHRKIQDYGPLYEAVDGLPEKLRLAVILFYFEEMDIAATAQVLGIPEGTREIPIKQSKKTIEGGAWP